MKTVKFVLGITGLLIFGPLLNSQQRAGSIAGSVLLDSRLGLQDARVLYNRIGLMKRDSRGSLVALEPDVSGSVRTIAEGSFRIDGLAPGTYHLCALPVQAGQIRSCDSPNQPVAVREASTTTGVNLVVRTGVLLNIVIDDPQAMITPKTLSVGWMSQYGGYSPAIQSARTAQSATFTVAIPRDSSGHLFLDGSLTILDTAGAPLKMRARSVPVSVSQETDSGHGLRPWMAKFNDFLQDVYDAGYTKVTPTPVLMAAWSAASSHFYTDRAVTSCGVSKNLRFLPWLPFGLVIKPTDPCLTNPMIACDANEMVPDCLGNNNAYNPPGSGGAVGNTYNFWEIGSPPAPWNSFFSLMDHVLFQVKAHGLTIADFDLQNEVDLLNFTVVARLIRDNTHSVDVLGAIQQKMNANFPDSGNRVTFSTTLTRPKEAQVPYTDCNSFYGDKAMIILESERRAAISNGPIGTPDFGPNPDPSLPCNGTQGDMIQLGLLNYSQPKVINIHAYPCIEGPDCDAPITQPGAGDATLVAKDFYSGVLAYLQRYSAEWSLTDRKVMFGEVSPTHNSDPTPPSCNETYRNIRAYNNVNGFMQSTLPGSAAGPNTVLRVWYNIQNPCYAQSGLPAIKPPYGH